MRWNPRRVFQRSRPESGGDTLEPLARLARAGGPAAETVETVGFWTAVVLPFGYVPLLLTGLSSGRDAALLGLLVVLHVVALRAGHAHRPD
ncbi:MAG: hypothetical protein ABEJ05_10445 [Haloglomus sp.]